MNEVKKKILIFTDGASSGNPGPGGWGAVLSFDDQIVELGGGEDITTNNRMELGAVVGAFEFINAYGLSTNDYSVVVYSDSTYVVNGITKWIYGWLKNNWISTQKKSVVNRDLWESLKEKTDSYEIKWNVLPGHSGVPGNERADKIAVAFRDSDDPGLFQGQESDYNIDISNVSYDEALKKAKDSKKKRSGAKAYSYLSLVNGTLRRHYNWADCEKLVKGKSGVRFKKSLDAQDELEIIRSWGKSINDIEG